jgi:hypothetical protein
MMKDADRYEVSHMVWSGTDRGLTQIPFQPITSGYVVGLTNNNKTMTAKYQQSYHLVTMGVDYSTMDVLLRSDSTYL